MPKDDNPKCGKIMKEGNFEELEKYFEELTNYDSNDDKDAESSRMKRTSSDSSENKAKENAVKESKRLNYYLTKEAIRNRRSTSASKDCRYVLSHPIMFFFQ